VTALAVRQRELAHRFGGCVEVTLFWDVDEDSTNIEVRHPATGEMLSFDVPADEALDAFYHPFAHLPFAADA
jgi:hypothetical protein